MITSIRLTAFVVASLASTACATIMHGSRQDVSIASVPSGASVTINGQERGKTPVAVELPRKDKHLLRIELPGYLPFESYLTRKISGWVWGNLVFGGIPGLAIDAITGGLYIVKPEDVTAMLTASATPASGARPSSGAQARPPTASTPLPTAELAPASGAELGAAEVPEPPADRPDEQPAIVVLASSRVRIVTEPAGAGVYMGSTKIGTTTADGFLIELPSGRTVCRLEAAGFEAAERHFVVPETPATGSPSTAVVVIRLRPKSR